MFSTSNLEMCFAPERREFFPHPNVQNWSEHGVFCTFWVGNVLRTTAACFFLRHPNFQNWSEHGVLCTFWRHPNFQNWSEHGVFCTFWVGNVLCATAACHFSTSELLRLVRTWCVLCILSWTCASRHSRVPFFLTSSEHGVFCTFWVGNVLCATAACHFSTSELPKLVRTWCVLYILSWKCASRHTSVPFFGHPNFQKWSEHAFWVGNVLRATAGCNFSFLIWAGDSATAALASLLFASQPANHWKKLEKHNVSRS